MISSLSFTGNLGATGEIKARNLASLTVPGLLAGTVTTTAALTALKAGTITAGSYTLTNLAPGANQVIRAVVTVARGAAVGTVKDCLVTSTSMADSSKRDAVKARTSVK